jgi:hypothetical protein
MKIGLVFPEIVRGVDVGYIKKELDIPEDLDIRDALKRMDAQALRKWEDDGDGGCSYGSLLTEGTFEPDGKYLIKVDENRMAFSRNFKSSSFAAYLKGNER